MTMIGDNSTSSESSKSEALSGVDTLWAIEAHKKNVLALEFDPTGELIATGSADGFARLWNAATGQLVRVLKTEGAFLISLAFSADGKLILTGGADGHLTLWRVADGERLDRFKAHHESIRCVTFFPKLNAVVSCGRDGFVKIWEIGTGLLLHFWAAHEKKGVLRLQFSPDGELLATASRDRTVKLWRTADWTQQSVLIGHQAPVNSVAFDPRGGRLASAGGDRSVKLWDYRTGQLITSLEAHTHVIDAVAFSPDGAFLASKSRDDTIVFWDATSWRIATILPALSCKTWWIPTLCFHPTRPLLATIIAVLRGSEMNQAKFLHIWHYDQSTLLASAGSQSPRLLPLAHHTTAKIVLVGESGVGKTSLGWYIAHGEFKEHASTHGQQFWLLNQLSAKRDDGTECEAVLWDLSPTRLNI